MATSPSPRAIETAIATGFAVDDTIDLPSGYVPGQASHHDQWSWPHPCLTCASLIRQGQTATAAAEAHRAIWTRTAEALPDNAAALIVSHGACAGCLRQVGHGLENAAPLQARPWRPAAKRVEAAQ